MNILKLTAILSLVALTATPTYAASHRKKHRSHRGSVNGMTSVQPANGARKATRSGGPAGGSSTE